MRTQASQTFRKFFGAILVAVVIGIFCSPGQAAKLSPKLQNQLATLADNAPVGVVIVSFNTSTGLNESHLNVLRAVGVTGGQTFPTLGMVSQPMTAGQVRALSNNSAVRSLWSNDRLQYFMHQARVLGGVQKLQTDSQMTTRNGGFPVSGAGDFSVLVIDSGIDATHADLPFGTKVVQNVHPILATSTLSGFTPNVTVENIPDTDESVGHGTHCAGIVGGSGVRSGGLFTGVAPGAKLVGAGLGAAILVVNPLGAWEWGLANQYNYGIRVVTNSYGPLGGGEFDPDNPITIASRMAYERNITVLFAGGNDGAATNTLSPYAKADWVIGVAAGTKEGTLADFSSRGTPRAQRLGDNNPLNDNDAPTLTAPGTGRAFESNAARFTSAIASVRSTSNLTANGTTADAELPIGMIPFYTQISGTSMATPYAAGVVALMLDADPTLTPSEIKQILVDTASRMPGYDDYEVGAGYINAYAAVDKVFNRSKAYSSLQNVSFNAVFGEERPAQQTFHIDFNPAVTGPTSVNATTFTVASNMNVLDVSAVVDTLAEEGTGNLVGIRLTAPNGRVYSTAIDFPVIGSNRRQIIVDNPQAGTWTLEVRGARGLTAVEQAASPTQLALPGPVDGAIVQVKYILPNIADLAGHPQQAAIETAIKSRLIDIHSDGLFRPNQTVNRQDLANSVGLNSSLRQSLGANPRFTDVPSYFRNIAEAVAADGSTLRDFNFVPKGIISTTNNTFNPMGNANRLDLAVAFIRALGHDEAARARANQPVMFNGSVLSDNTQIPGELRGYVQLAIDKGLLEAFPAEVRNLGNGQFVVLPGPRFEPNTTLTRATLAMKLNSFNQLFTTGG